MRDIKKFNTLQGNEVPIKSIVVDACAMHFYFGGGCRGGDCECPEICNKKPAAIRDIISKIDSKELKLVYTEQTLEKYLKTCPPDFKEIWIIWDNDGRVEQHQRIDSLRVAKQLKQHGFSNEDYNFIIATNQTTTKLIITDDVDYWDPKCKGKQATHRAKEMLKLGKRGVVYKILEKNGISPLSLPNAAGKF